MKRIILILLLISFIYAQNIKYPLTISSAVDTLINRMNTEDQFILKSTPKNKLYLFHFGLGTWIRNNFGLWGLNESLIEECSKIQKTDMIHPDNASGIIIDSLWSALQEKEYNFDIPKPINIK